MNPWAVSALAIGAAVGWIGHKTGVAWVMKHYRALVHKTDEGKDEVCATEDDEENDGLLI